MVNRAALQRLTVKYFVETVKTYLFQALHIICRARRQQDEHAECPLGIPHFKDLCLQLLYETDSKQALLVHHLHSPLFILQWTR